jgi:hypothetical protein
MLTVAEALAWYLIIIRYSPHTHKPATITNKRGYLSSPPPPPQAPQQHPQTHTHAAPQPPPKNNNRSPSPSPSKQESPSQTKPQINEALAAEERSRDRRDDATRLAQDKGRCREHCVNERVHTSGKRESKRTQGAHSKQTAHTTHSGARPSQPQQCAM